MESRLQVKMNSPDSARDVEDISIKKEEPEDISIKQEEPEDISIKQEEPEDISIKQEETEDHPHISKYFHSKITLSSIKFSFGL